MNPSLSSTNLTPDQVNGIFREIANNKKMKLRILSISGVGSISSVPEDIFSEGVIKLEEFHCVGTRLTSEQVRSVFMKILTRKEFKLRVLGLTGMLLSKVTRIYPHSHTGYAVQSCSKNTFALFRASTLTVEDFIEMRDTFELMEQFPEQYATTPAPASSIQI